MWKDRKLISSERIVLPNGEDGWRITSTFDMNGKTETIPHFIHDHCFAVRAAEYGIDPSDIETLLDIVLNEVFIYEQDIEYATTIYGHASVAETRKAHVGRCARVKLRQRLSTRRNKSTLAARAANPSDPLTAAQAEEPHPLQKVWDHLQDNPVQPEHVRYYENVVKRARREKGLLEKSEE